MSAQEPRPRPLGERWLERIERRLYADLYGVLIDSVARECGIEWAWKEPWLRLTCRQADHPFFNRIMGVCDPGQGIDRWLEQTAEHYREHGVKRWMLQVAPSDDGQKLVDAFRAKDLERLRGWAKHVAEVPHLAVPAPDPSFDLRIETISPDRALDWASIVAAEFEFPPDSQGWPAATVGLPGWHHYVVYDDDRPVACSALVAIDRVGTLGFTATLKSHRRRGCQSALIAARLHDARRLDLNWIVTETDEDLPDRPNSSYRNIVRLGLPALWVRSNWGPPPT